MQNLEFIFSDLSLSIYLSKHFYDIPIKFSLWISLFTWQITHLLKLTHFVLFSFFCFFFCKIQEKQGFLGWSLFLKFLIKSLQHSAFEKFNHYVLLIDDAYNPLTLQSWKKRTFKYISIIKKNLTKLFRQWIWLLLYKVSQIWEEFL